jgi:FMN phosphatase YigB (HAD superfamily)
MRLAKKGVGPEEVLYVGTRLQGDLAIAKQLGMRTALYTADRGMLRVDPADMKNPDVKPDRLLTDLNQIRDVLALV